MMRNDTEFAGAVTLPPGGARRKRVVIADDGFEAALVLLDQNHPVDAGSRFGHRGRTWEIRGGRRGSRVLVAEPVDHSGQ